VTIDYFDGFFPGNWPPNLRNWAISITEYLKQSSGRGQPVYLNAEIDDLQSMAQLGHLPQSDDIENDFLVTFDESVIKRPTTTAEAKNSFKKFESVFSKWDPKKSSGNGPPFIPILLLTVMAAARMRTSTDKRATNYYGRLCEVLGIDIKHKDAVGDSYRRHLAPLWALYCQWLEINSHIGIPTAYLDHSLGFANFVGVPVGQALLRAKEQRQIESEFFKLFIDGSERENVEVDEFLSALSDWIRGADCPENIKKAFANAPDEINDAVWAIFNRWTPSELEVKSAPRNPKLLIGGHITSKLGQPHLSLYLRSTHEHRSLSVLELRLKTDDRELTVSSRPDQSLGSGSQISGCTVEDLLYRSLSLRGEMKETNLHDEERFVAERKPCAVISLDVLTPSTWVESRWMKIGQTYNLLVAEPVLERAMSEMRDVGIGGQLTTLSGLPNQWKAVVGFTPTSQPQKDSLLRIQHAKHLPITLTSGTRLLGSGRAVEYFAAEPPMVLIDLGALSEKKCSLAEALIRIHSGNQVVREFRPTSETQALADLSAGSYLVELIIPSQKKPLAELRLTLRSPDLPRTYSVIDEHSVALRLGTITGSDTWNLLELSADDCLMQGAVVTKGKLCVTPREFASLQPGAEVMPDSFEDDQQDSMPFANLTGANVTFAQCIIDVTARCLHTKNLEPPLAGRVSEWIYMTCVHCGKVVKAGTRGKPRDFKKALTKKATVLARSDLITGEESAAARISAGPSQFSYQETEKSQLDYRLWSLGSGDKRSSAVLSELHELRLVSEVLWYAAAAGHVDFNGMECDRVAEQWRVTPSALIFYPSGTARWVGHRSESSIASVISMLGGVEKITRINSTSTLPYLTDVKLSSCPETVELEGIYSDTKQAMTLVYNLPSLRELLEQLPQTVITNSAYSAQMFDLDTRQWSEKGEDIQRGSAVREGSYGNEYYFIRTAEPRGYDAVRCGYRLAKHLAANYHGRLLVTFEEETQKLRCPLGADLPLLYTRGLIFATGELPTREKGSIVYPGVSAEVFERVALLLSN